MRRFHADVATYWTVASLAAVAGMSRSSFAERFRMRVGMAPLDYLTRWRMYRVRRALSKLTLASPKSRSATAIGPEHRAASHSSGFTVIRRDIFARQGSPPGTFEEVRTRGYEIRTIQVSASVASCRRLLN
jgi:AraC-like DNA-binding protein